MGHETELKLSLPADQVETLKKHPFWQQYASKPECFYLGNTYFDTPDGALNQAQVALRIREKNGQYWQTLKTKGESINGLTRRGEREWPIGSSVLDIDGLLNIWPEHLPAVDFQLLEPLFSTNFERMRWKIEWLQPGARIEAALDIGQIVAGSQSSPICELELELLEGDELALSKVAEYLKKDIKLEPSDKSKAERGFEVLAYVNRV